MRATYFYRNVPPKWSSWNAVHLCNCARQLTMNTKQMIINGPILDSDALFRPLMS